MTDTDITDLIAKLEKATEGSSAYWCDTCGRVYLQMPLINHSNDGGLLRNGSMNCSGFIEVGTPQECIAALRANDME
ncbi:MAG: hypothetical protein ACR2RF_26100 [Geminicoccaceae bacterium]